MRARRLDRRHRRSERDHVVLRLFARPSTRCTRAGRTTRSTSSSKRPSGDRSGQARRAVRQDPGDLQRDRADRSALRDALPGRVPQERQGLRADPARQQPLRRSLAREVGCITSASRTDGPSASQRHAAPGRLPICCGAHRLPLLSYIFRRVLQLIPTIDLHPDRRLRARAAAAGRSGQRHAGRPRDRRRRRAGSTTSSASTSRSRCSSSSSPSRC